MSNVSECQLLRLFHLGRQRHNSAGHYQRFQEQQAGMIAGYLEKHGIALNGSRIVDLGSGMAGYGIEFHRRGARVLFLDLVKPPATPLQQLEATLGDARNIPLRNGSVDLVFCSSLIEHISNPQQVILEVERILRTGGIAYVSFPPYYSPRGGHEFAPWHYFGERIARRLVDRRKSFPGWMQEHYGFQSSSSDWESLYGSSGLNKLTIRRFRSILSKSSFVCVDISTRHFPFGFAKWPWLGEILTWHVQFLLKKTPPAERVR